MMVMTYEEIAKIILKKDFEPIAELYRNICAGKKLSAQQKKQLLGIFDKDEADDLEMEIEEGEGAVYFLVYYGIEKDRIYFVDWSGEDDEGEVESSIRRIVGKYDSSFSSKFQWDVMAFNGTLDWDSLERGDYIVLLFQALNDKLKELGFQMVFIDTGSDQYNYTVLPAEEAQQLLHSESPLDIYDLTEYSIEITEVPADSKAVVLYLKSKLEISMEEAKAKVEQLPLVLATGESRSRVDKLAADLEELGCKYVVKEA